MTVGLKKLLTVSFLLLSIQVSAADIPSSSKLDLTFGGRLHLDYRVSDNGEDRYSDPIYRRTRLWGSAKVGGNWDFYGHLNLLDSKGRLDPKTLLLFARYKGWGPEAVLTVGRQKELFGLDIVTSSNDITMLERSMLTSLYAPVYNNGVQLEGHLSKWGYGIGLFDTRDSQYPSEKFDHAATGRFYFTPIEGNGKLFHFALSYTNRQAEAGGENLVASNMELAAVNENVHFQAEFSDGKRGGADADGGYIQLGWFVTGERRPYRDGKFETVVPIRYGGALELLVRYDHLNSDASLVYANRDINQLTLGTNWYFDRKWRLGFNFTDTRNQRDGSHAKGARARIQWLF